MTEPAGVNETLAELLIDGLWPAENKAGFCAF